MDPALIPAVDIDLTIMTLQFSLLSILFCMFLIHLYNTSTFEVSDDFASNHTEVTYFCPDFL